MTVVLVSSKVTVASALLRSTSAFVTPLILVSDLFTEIVQATHVMPETESTTVLTSAKAAVAKKTAAMQHAATKRGDRFMTWPLDEQRGVVRKAKQRERDDRDYPERNLVEAAG